MDLREMTAAADGWFRPEAGFFGPEYLLLYHERGIFEHTDEEVAFLTELLQARGCADGAVLDMCCGHGRHTVPLAQRGFQMSGFDLNPFFLERAREAAEAVGVQVAWSEGDIRTLPFSDATFAAVTNLFTAFGYFADDADHQAVFGQVARVLRPGGTFVIELLARTWLMRNFKSTAIDRLPGGTIIICERTFDFTTSASVELRTTVHPDGKRTEKVDRLRIFDLHELVAMGHRVGLQFVEARDGYSNRSYGLESDRRLLAVFERV